MASANLSQSGPMAIDPAGLTVNHPFDIIVQSQLRVLEQLSLTQPKNEADLYRHFGVDVLNLVLGPQGDGGDDLHPGENPSSLAKSLPAWVKLGCLKEVSGGYCLTEAGVARRDVMREIKRRATENIQPARTEPAPDTAS